MTTIEISEDFKEKIVSALDDSNDQTEITKAGIFDLCDALSGSDNSKFSVEDAKKEMHRRGL